MTGAQGSQALARGAQPASAGTGVPAPLFRPGSTRLQSDFCHSRRRLPELILLLQETPPQSYLGQAAPWQTGQGEPQRNGLLALTAASAPVGIGVGVSPRGPWAPPSHIRTGRSSGNQRTPVVSFQEKEKRRFWPLRTGPYGAVARVPELSDRSQGDRGWPGVPLGTWRFAPC